MTVLQWLFSFGGLLLREKAGWRNAKQDLSRSESISSLTWQEFYGGSAKNASIEHSRRHLHQLQRSF